MVGPSFSLLFYKKKKKIQANTERGAFFQANFHRCQAQQSGPCTRPTFQAYTRELQCVPLTFHQNKSSSSNAKCVPLTSTKLLFGFCPNTVYRSLEILLKQARVDCCSCFVVGYYCNI
jgi:hypothetical protein